jgi:O-antigen/teichoic acid export membrane protein
MILFLSFSNIIGNALNIAAGLFTAKWLLPEQLGLFNGFSVITSYIILAQLGIPSGLGRELSFYIGKGDTAKAKALRRRRTVLGTHCWG